MPVEWTPTHDDPRGGRRRTRRSNIKDEALRLENREVLTVHEDGVAWLAVYGTGTWGYGHKTDAGVVMRSFAAGLHWVDQVTVDYARRSGIPTLMITEELPEVDRRTLPGPLGPEHLRLPSDGSLVPASSPAPTAEQPVVDPGGAPLDFPCEYCPERFPSAAMRSRHVEFEHEQDIRAELDAQPEPEPVEPALTDA